jgi:hypothetical protein
MEKPNIKPRIYLAVPCYRALDAGFAQCLLKFQKWVQDCETFDWHLDFIVGDSLVSRARNTLTARFLQSSSTHLLFLDSDLIFSGEQIERLIKHDRDIIAGLYCKKDPRGPAQVVMNKHAGQAEIAIDSEGIADVAYVGTGFMLIKREVVEKMKAAYPANDFIADDTKTSEHDWWQVGVYHYKDGTSRYLSEDWFFCQKCLDLGYKIYADTHVLAKHVGVGIYPLPHQEEGLFGQSKVIGNPCEEAQDGVGNPSSENLEESTVGWKG